MYATVGDDHVANFYQLAGLEECLAAVASLLLLAERASPNHLNLILKCSANYSGDPPVMYIVLMEFDRERVAGFWGKKRGEVVPV